jgi:hypothetical protein
MLNVRGSISIQNPSTVRTDINVADGADVTGNNTANDVLTGTGKAVAEHGAIKNFSSLTDDGGTLEISNSVLRVLGADGIQLEPGADLFVNSEAGNSGSIYFLTAAGEYVEFAANYSDGILFISPKTYDTSGLWVGYSDAGTTDMRFRRIVTSSHSLDMFVADRSGSSGWIRLSNADNTSVNTPSTELWVNPDAVQIEDWSGTTGYGGRLNCDNDAYFAKDVSALTFTDRTPAFEGDALSELKKIKGKNGKIDHATLPKMAQRETKERIYTKDEKRNKIKDKDGKPIYEDIKVPGRDLGAMISILTVAVQQLTDKVEALEAKWSQKT